MTARARRRHVSRAAGQGVLLFPALGIGLERLLPVRFLRGGFPWEHSVFVAGALAATLCRLRGRYTVVGWRSWDEPFRSYNSARGTCDDEAYRYAAGG